MWDLSSQTRDWTHIPSVGRQMLNHGTTREVPAMYFKYLPACLIATFTGHHLSEALWTSPSTVIPLFFSSLYPYLICSTYHSTLQLLALLYISITKSNSLSILIHLYFPSTVSVTSASVWEVTMVRWLCLSSCWSVMSRLTNVSCPCCLPHSMPLDTEMKHMLHCLVESGKHWWHGVIHATYEL